MPTLTDLLQQHLNPAEAAKVLASARDVITYRLTPAAADLPATASRVGGIGYWPQQQPYPRNAEGQPLALLAQINLADLADTAAQGLPAQGLLAFYLDPHSDLIGMEDGGSRCVYFADTTAPTLSRSEQRALFNADAFPYWEEETDTADDDDSEDGDEAAATTALVQQFVADNNALMAEKNHPALSQAWENERAVLLQQNFGSQAELALFLTATGMPESNQLYWQLYGGVNPVVMAASEQIFGFASDSGAGGQGWAHPVYGEYAMQFATQRQYLLHDSLEFEQYYGLSLYDWAEAQGLTEHEEEAITNALNREQNLNSLLGYAFFTQTDPRLETPEHRRSRLLFQLDSSGHDDDVDIMWGDAGIGAFFINADDLAAGRFDRAWLNWDCY